MAETFDQRYDRLMEEKALLVKAFEHPGTQLIFTKMKDRAKASLHDLEKCDVDTESGREMFHRIQARRYVILQEIPELINEIINVDLPREQGKKRWSFNLWLEQIRANLRRFFKVLN